MTPNLLYKGDKPARNRQPLVNDLIQDLNLDHIFKAMAQGDDYIYRVASDVIMNSLTDIGTISYRQEILNDCMARANEAKRLYSLATDAVNETNRYKENTKPSYARVVSATTRLASSAKLLELTVSHLEILMKYASEVRNRFTSEGMVRFFKTIEEKITGNFLDRAEKLISELQCLGDYRITLGAKLGLGLKGSGYVLRSLERKGFLMLRKLKKTFARKAVTIDLESMGIAKSAKDFQEAALIRVLRVVNSFSEKAVRFFEELRFETAFYTGCINLAGALEKLKAPFTMPNAYDAGERKLCFKGLYDMSLALQEKRLPVPNDLATEDIWLYIVTGANQGGKSTYLRSIGLAQVMMQCGMFVAAESFGSNVSDAVLTHFIRGEDAAMNSGKLDLELKRMSEIMKHITGNSLLLMNESFATTTEREGARIAKGIILALYENRNKTIFVTHLFDFADEFHKRGEPHAYFLRAERRDQGERTFRIIPGKPLYTSYGEDLYNAIIGPESAGE